MKEVQIIFSVKPDLSRLVGTVITINQKTLMIRLREDFLPVDLAEEAFLFIKSKFNFLSKKFIITRY